MYDAKRRINNPVFNAKLYSRLQSMKTTNDESKCPTLLPSLLQREPQQHTKHGYTTPAQKITTGYIQLVDKIRKKRYSLRSQNRIPHPNA